MEQLKFYKVASLGLLLLNLGIIAFFWFNRPPHSHLPPPGQGPNNEATAFQNKTIGLLDLDEEQAATFRDLARGHGEEIGNLNRDQTNSLQAYFETAYQATTLAVRDSLLNGIQEIESRKIVTTLDHFLAVKALLDEDQLSEFDEFVSEAIGRILDVGKKSAPPPKD